jgi:hypothetical protein
MKNFVPLASSLWPLAFLKKGQETELTISPIQLLSCGVHERCMPLKSKEDSENAVGIAPIGVAAGPSNGGLGLLAFKPSG